MTDPVGWIYEDDEGRMMFTQVPQNPPFWEPVYRARKQWQGLTDEEVDEYWDESVSTGCRLSFGMGVDYANRVLKEKNA